jgi:prepilin-type processing-associated H-X9-DG protein
MTRLNSRRRCRCAFTYLDLLVVISVVPFIGAGCWHASCRSRETANRVKCASNLRQIGQALLLYANDNRGVYPRTRASAGPVRKPTFGTAAAATQPFKADGPAENDVTAALFLLLRTQDITSEVFACPSSNSEKDIYENLTPAQRSNFTDYKKNLSYSYQNPYADDAAIGKGFMLTSTLGEEFAVAADVNPGTAPAGSDNVLGPKPTSSAKEMKLANSSNHDKDGQNILYGDGHVAWESSPFVGVNKDNIYTTADGQVNASPVDGNDSVLLPTDD